MQLKSHSQDKNNSNANSLSIVSEKISREMINFNIWDDRIPFIVKWTQMDLKNRLLLGQRLDFHACDRSDMPAVTFTPAILTAFFSLYWFTVAPPPLPVHWYLTHWNYICIIYLLLWFMCLFLLSVCPSPLQNLPLSSSLTPTGQVKHLETILIGTDDI